MVMAMRKRSRMQTDGSPLDRALLAAAFTGIGVFAVLVLLLHWIKAPAHDISTDAMSYYAVGDFGYLMSIAFVGLGISHLAMAARLQHLIRRCLVPSLLTLVGVCFLASAVFETDPKNTVPPSTNGLIHVLVGLFVFVVMALTPWVFAGSLRRVPALAWLARASLIFGVGTVAAFLAIPLAFRDAYFGIGQRIFVALYLSWLIMVALATARMDGSRSPRPAPIDAALGGA
jgi:Protein of unknown function (DUF998)